jgi:hypothetical protein
VFENVGFGLNAHHADSRRKAMLLAKSRCLLQQPAMRQENH